MAFARRCKRFHVEGGWLVRVLRGAVSTEYLPPDSKVAGISDDTEQPNAFWLFIESGSFDPIEEGEPVPIGYFKGGPIGRT